MRVQRKCQCAGWSWLPPRPFLPTSADESDQNRVAFLKAERYNKNLLGDQLAQLAPHRKAARDTAVTMLQPLSLNLCSLDSGVCGKWGQGRVC